MKHYRLRIFTLILTSCCTLTIAACGDGRPDPKTAFETLKVAALKGDGGVVYDLLDSAIRSKQDAGIQMQASQREGLPADEKAKWDTISKYKGREAFAKMFGLNKEKFTERFKGEHTILRVDTLYALTVETKDAKGLKKADVMLFRWYNGHYCFSSVPEPPQTAPPPTPQPQTAPAPAPAPPADGKMPPPSADGKTQAPPAKVK